MEYNLAISIFLYVLIPLSMHLPGAWVAWPVERLTLDLN